MMILLVILMLLSFASPAWSANRWVSKSGSNSNSCAAIVSATEPANLATGSKLTINSAKACLVAGDTLFIKAGTYGEGVIAAPTGGTATNRITIKNAPGETVTVTRGGQSPIDCLFCFTSAAQSYVTLEGLILQGEDIVGYGIYANTANGLHFVNVEVSHSRGSGIYSTVGKNHQLLNVSVHHAAALGCVGGTEVGKCHGVYMSDSGHLIDGGSFYNNESHGIHFYPAPLGVTVRNIKAYDNLYAGIGIYTKNGHRVYNNLVWGNDVVGLKFSGSSGFIANNTFYNNGQLGIYIPSGSSNVVRNNIVYTHDTNILNSGTSTTLSNNLTTNPNFVSAAGSNFALQANSAAIDAGTVIATGCTANNCSGGYNGGNPDIGAFETIGIASAEVGVVNASTLVVNIQNNTSYSPLATNAVLPATACTGFTFPGLSYSTCTRNGNNQYRFALTAPAVQGPTYTGSYSPGNVTDGARLGRTSDSTTSGSNQRLNAITSFAVTNNVTGTGPVSPTIGQLIVRNAAPTVVEIHTNTNDPPMLPESPTQCAGFTFTGKTISSCLRDVTDTKRFNATVSAAFVCGEQQTGAYSQSGNVTSSASGNLELVAFSGVAITNQVSGDCPPATPIARWRFNEGTGGTTADETGNGHIGTISGATWTTGITGGGLSFDGTNDEVTVADHNNLDFTSAFTIAAWVQPTVAQTTFRAILVKNYKYYLYATNSGVYCGAGFPVGGFSGAANRTVCHASALPVNQWTHVAVTYDGAVLRFYRGGVEVSSTTATDAATASTGTLQIGASQFGEFFQGKIDEVLLYNVALPPADVANLTSVAEVPTIATTTVKDSAPGTVEVCVATNDGPILPQNDCTGFTVAGHTVVDCDRNVTVNTCADVDVTPDFTAGEQRNLTYSQATGNVTSSHTDTPELAGATVPITNQVIDPAPTAASIVQHSFRFECWGGTESNPDPGCGTATALNRLTYAGGCFKLRVGLQNEGNADKGSVGYHPTAQKNGTGDFEAIPDVCLTDGICFGLPPEMQGAVSTTEQLTSDPTNFIPGGVQLSAAEVPSVALDRNKRTEFLDPFCLGPNVQAGDFWRFKWKETGNLDLDSYGTEPDDLPQVTVHTGMGLQFGGGVGGGLRQ